MKPKYKDLTGKVFGNWKALELAPGHATGTRGRLWHCECQCDDKTRKIISANTLQSKQRLNQSCGCQDNRSLRPYEALFNRLRYDNKWNRRSRPVHLTYEDFLGIIEPGKCHYCLVPLTWTKTNLVNGSGYHLDRKNNALDYTITNCVPCCERCNKAKRDFFTYEDWYGMTAYLRKEKNETEISITDCANMVV